MEGPLRVFTLWIPACKPRLTRSPLGSCDGGSPHRKSTGKHGLKQLSPSTAFSSCPQHSKQELNIGAKRQQQKGPRGSLNGKRDCPTGFCLSLAGGLRNGSHTHSNTTRYPHRCTQTHTHTHSLRPQLVLMVPLCELEGGATLKMQVARASLTRGLWCGFQPPPTPAGCPKPGTLGTTTWNGPIYTSSRVPRVCGHRVGGGLSRENAAFP